MGLMDKMKSQAAVLAERAQEGARMGQDRLAQAQDKHHSDALLLELGGLSYLARSGRPVEGSDARIEELGRQLAAFEALHGPVTVTPAVPRAGHSATYLPGGVGHSAPAPESAWAGTPAPHADPAGAGAEPFSMGNSAPPAASGLGIPTGSYASEDEPGKDEGAR